MTDKEHILKLQRGEYWIVPESDYGKAEIWFMNNTYFLFEIPMFGGNPQYNSAYGMHNVDKMIDTYMSWT